MKMLSFEGKQKTGAGRLVFCYTSQLKNETDGMYSVLLKLSMKLVF